LKVNAAKKTTNKAEDIILFSNESDQPQNTKEIEKKRIIGIFQHFDQVNGNEIL
jgi:hypothetical protein